MVDQTGGKRQQAEFQHDKEPASKKPRLGTTALQPNRSTSLLSGPLGEPPILCYTEIIENVEEQLKEMKEKPEKFHPKTAVHMQGLDIDVERRLHLLYTDWCESKITEAIHSNKVEDKKLYRGLFRELLGDVGVLTEHDWTGFYKTYYPRSRNRDGETISLSSEDSESDSESGSSSPGNADVSMPDTAAEAGR